MQEKFGRYFRNGAYSVRFVLVGAVLGALVLAGAVRVAQAAYPSDSVAQYAGCLSTNGSGGNIDRVAVGLTPTKPCSSNEVLVHLSGGTITQVTAGTGLTGGGNNGFVTLGITPSFQLPQSNCSSGQFVASNGSGGWSCQSQKTYSGSDFALSNQSCGSGQFLTGIDASGVKQCAVDQTYSNGTGLDLSGNTFSLSSGYQLPQGCSSGQVATSNGNNTWSCHSGTGSMYTYEVSGGYVTVGDPLDLSGDTESSWVYCNYGDLVTGGGEYTDHVDQVYNGPYGNGWEVTGSTGPFSQGHVQAHAMCLHVG
jgi:hypothetical protein